MILKEAMTKIYAMDFDNDEFMNLLGRILFSCTTLTVGEYAEQLANIYHHHEKSGRQPGRRDYLDLLNSVLKVEMTALGKSAREAEGMPPLTWDLELKELPADSLYSSVKGRSLLSKIQSFFGG